MFEIGIIRYVNLIFCRMLTSVNSSTCRRVSMKVRSQALSGHLPGLLSPQIEYAASVSLGLISFVRNFQTRQICCSALRSWAKRSVCFVKLSASMLKRRFFEGERLRNCSITGVWLTELDTCVKGIFSFLTALLCMFHAAHFVQVQQKALLSSLLPLWV